MKIVQSNKWHPRSSNFHDLPKPMLCKKGDLKNKKRKQGIKEKDRSVVVPLVLITEFIPLWFFYCSCLSLYLSRSLSQSLSLALDFAGKRSPAQVREDNPTAPALYTILQFTKRALVHGPFILKTHSWFLGVTVTNVWHWHKYPLNSFYII